MHCLPHSLAVEKKKHLLLFHFLILRIWIIQFGENQRYLNVWIGFKENSFFLFAEDYWAWNRIRLGKPRWLNPLKHRIYKHLYCNYLLWDISTDFQSFILGMKVTFLTLSWISFWADVGQPKWQGGGVASFFVSKCWSAKAWQRKWDSFLCQWSLQCLIKKFHVNANVNITKYSNI